MQNREQLPTQKPLANGEVALQFQQDETKTELPVKEPKLGQLADELQRIGLSPLQDAIIMRRLLDEELWS